MLLFIFPICSLNVKNETFFLCIQMIYTVTRFSVCLEKWLSLQQHDHECQDNWLIWILLGLQPQPQPPPAVNELTPCWASSPQQRVCSSLKARKFSFSSVRAYVHSQIKFILTYISHTRVLRKSRSVNSAHTALFHSYPDHVSYLQTYKWVCFCLYWPLSLMQKASRCSASRCSASSVAFSVLTSTALSTLPTTLHSVVLQGDR